MKLPQNAVQGQQGPERAPPPLHQPVLPTSPRHLTILRHVPGQCSAQKGGNWEDWGEGFLLGAPSFVLGPDLQ